MRAMTDLIAEQEIFRGLAPEYLELLAGCATNQVFEPGAVLFHEGRPAAEFWILRRGLVALRTNVPGRGGIVLDTIGPEEVLGWSWLVPPYRWQFDAEALELTRALHFDARCVRDKFDADTRLGYEMLRRFVPLIKERLQATRLRLVDVYGHGARA